jgi:hypothetical protein
MSSSSGPGATVAASVAAVLGLASAGVSGYWALGGTGLLDTVGGDIERWGRERSTAVLVVLWVLVVLKAVVGVAPLVVLGVGSPPLPAWTHGRAPRVLCWIAGVVLALYGGLLTVAGLLVEAGVIDAADDADEHALAWHAYVWDPWFALWGMAIVVALWRSRRPAVLPERAPVRR